MYGVNGQTVTEALIRSKAAQYPDIYSLAYQAKCRAFLGRKAIDCSGLVDLYLGVDKSAHQYYWDAAVRGLIGTLPSENRAGLLVFSKGSNGRIYHVGICEGGDFVIEARGIDYGVVRTKLGANGRWDLWARCALLDYDGGDDMVVKGTKSETVRRYQAGLYRLGYNLGSSGPGFDGVDADYGDKTDAAVALFKKEHGIVPADGSFIDVATGSLIVAALTVATAGSGAQAVALKKAEEKIAAAKAALA
jgi:hypothetical protein